MGDLGVNKPADEFANEAALAADGAARILIDAEGPSYQDNALVELAIAVTYLSQAVRELSRDVRRIKA